jgi:hypothetical protein
MTNGLTVSSWMDWKRSERTLRELEKQYNLTPVTPSWDSEKQAPSTGQERRRRRETFQYERGLRLSPPEKPIKQRLQETIDQFTSLPLTLPNLIKQLTTVGVNVRISANDSGNLTGISYGFKGLAFKGSRLGKAYTLLGLQKYRNVSYDSSRDYLQIQQLCNSKTPPSDSTSTNSTQVSSTQWQRTQFVATVLNNLLASQKTNCLKGRNYQATLKAGQLSLIHLPSNTEILRAKSSENAWEPLTAFLSDQHIRDFNKIHSQLAQFNKTKQIKKDSFVKF